MGSPIVVMGVSGSGKSTVGAALAQRLRVPFADADDFHPPANIDKMTTGQALNDDDRYPWLEAIAEWLAARCTDGGVMSCSALKRTYRDQLRRQCPNIDLPSSRRHAGSHRQATGQPSRPFHARIASCIAVRHPRAAATGRRRRHRRRRSGHRFHRRKLSRAIGFARNGTGEEMTPALTVLGGRHRARRARRGRFAIGSSRPCRHCGHRRVDHGGQAAPVPGSHLRRPDRRHRRGGEHR